MDEKKIEKLYELMEAAKASGDEDAAAALRWAIFRLEQQISMTKRPGQPPAEYEMTEEVFRLREDME